MLLFLKASIISDGSKFVTRSISEDLFCFNKRSLTIPPTILMFPLFILIASTIFFMSEKEIL